MDSGKKTLYRKDSGAEEIDLGEISESEIRLTTSWGLDGIATYLPVPHSHPALSRLRRSLRSGDTFPIPLSPYKLTWGKYRGDRVGVFTYNTRGESGTAVFCP